MLQNNASLLGDQEAPVKVTAHPDCGRALAAHYPPDTLVRARILLVAMAVPALVRLKLSRLEWVLEPRRSLARPDEHAVQRTIELVESVLLLGRPLLRPGCLTRGVTLHYFLRRAGLDVRLCFGMGHPDGKEIAGHCWLEVDGSPFLERRDPRSVFVETYRIPSAPARA